MELFGLGLGLIVLLLLAGPIIGGLCLKYLIEYWGSKKKGRPVKANFLLCGLVCFVATLFIGPFIAIVIVGALLTWLISKFV